MFKKHNYALKPTHGQNIKLFDDFEKVSAR